MRQHEPPVRYIGDESANTFFHHGELRPVVGASHFQVLRANRSRPDEADGFGWTYNHAPNLAYWRDRFYLSYLSNPVSEHVPPGQTLLTSSEDGIHWEKPRVIFPVYRVPEGVYQPQEGVPPLPPASDAVMHQRMGFYTAADGRLLTLGFYGISAAHDDNPNDGTGIGRVVREVYADGALGPIFFIRYNRHAGWHEGNTSYPFFTASTDAGFVQACDDLLANKLATLQWWEEDRSTDGFYAIEGGKALSYYHLDDGRVIGLWKWSQVAISADKGESWSPLQSSPSLVMAGAKVWGQRTRDGRYVLVYNPTSDNIHRWPLAIAVSDDGQDFADLALVNGEVPPRRFMGIFKDFGLNYVRGIVEGNGAPPDDALWIAYSVNKEDIWVSRIPVPIHTQVTSAVDDTFDDCPLDGLIPDWNVYSPRWATVSVRQDGSAHKRVLILHDEDPYDYALAERIFPEGRHVEVDIKLAADETNEGDLYVDIQDGRGRLATSLVLTKEGGIRLWSGGSLVSAGFYQVGVWQTLHLSLDVERHEFALRRNGEVRLAAGTLMMPLHAVERLVLRTGPRRWLPAVDTDRFVGEDLPGADDKAKSVQFRVARVRITSHRMA